MTHYQLGANAGCLTGFLKGPIGTLGHLPKNDCQEFDDFGYRQIWDFKCPVTGNGNVCIAPGLCKSSQIRQLGVFFSTSGSLVTDFPGIGFFEYPGYPDNWTCQKANQLLDESPVRGGKAK